MGSCVSKKEHGVSQDDRTNSVDKLKEIELLRVKKLQGLQDIKINKNIVCLHEKPFQTCSNFGCNKIICCKCSTMCSICSIYKCHDHIKKCNICKNQYICCDDDCKVYSYCRICREHVCIMCKSSEGSNSFSKLCTNCTLQIP